MARRSLSRTRASEPQSRLGQRVSNAFRAGVASGERKLAEYKRRHRAKVSKQRRRQTLIRTGELAAAAGATGALRGVVGEKMDVVGVPLEGPIGAALHLAGMVLLPDKPVADHLHAVGDGLAASGASRGMERLVQRIRRRRQQTSEAPQQGAVSGYGAPMPPALPAPPAYPPALPATPTRYAPPPSASAGEVAPAADRALSDALAVMERTRNARRG